MKKTILTSIMAVWMLSGRAQDTPTPDSFKPQAGEKQFTFGLINNSSFFSIKKYKTPKFATRFGLSGYYSIQSSHYSNNSPTYQSYPDPIYSTLWSESSSKSSDFQLNAFLGFQKSFGDFKNFEPYVGIDFSVGNAFLDRENKSSNRDPNSTTVYLAENNRIFRSYVNPTASILPFIGFNYYLGERFSLGAEYRVSIFNLTYGAKATTENYYRYSDGNSFTNTNDDNHNVRASGAFSGSAYITASLFICSAKK